MSYWEEDDRVEHLMWLWAKGFSASVCAGKLGRVTRNAVISKIDRLRDAGYDVGPKRTTVTSRDQRKASRPKQQVSVTRETVADAQKEFPVDPTPLKETYMPPVEQMVVLQDLEEWHCRWPINDPRSPDFRFCGGKKVFGLPYCEHHVRDAFAPPRPPVSRETGKRELVLVVVGPEKVAAGEAPEREREEV